MNPIALIIRITFIFLFTLNICIAQTEELDSLQNLMKTANDTIQVNLLRQLGDKFRLIDKERAIEYGLQSLEKSKEIGFSEGEIKSYYALGLTYGMTGSYPESLNYFNKCLSLAKEHNNYVYMGMSYNSFGIVYKRIGDYTKSKDYYLKNLRLADSVNMDGSRHSTYINLGILYDLMNQQEEAIKSYEKALEVYKGPDKESVENSVLGNLAVIDYNNKDYEAAVLKYLKVKDYQEKHGDMLLLNTIYSNLGNCYLELEEWELSLEYLNKALNLATELSNKHIRPKIYYNLTSLMLKQKRYNEALRYSKDNIESLASSGQYKDRFDAHNKAFEIYKITAQYPKAIYHLNQSIVYKDSLLNETKVREIQNLQIQHDVYLKDKEIKEGELEVALLNTQVSQNRKRLLYLSIIAVLLLFSAGLLYYRYLGKMQANKIFREKNKLISEQNQVIEQMNVELEKRMLRAQMNPHFIFNSLSSIHHLINSNDRVNALKYLTKFSRLLRQVLESSININLVLKEEIELLKIYLELESLRFDNTFNYTISVDEKLDINAHEVPMLMVQPYIENAIIHGLIPKEGQKELTISFSDKNDLIACIIEDNGVGIQQKTEKAKSKRPSRGMSITQERIDKLKQLTNQELVKIENLNDGTVTGTRVTILIPK